MTNEAINSNRHNISVQDLSLIGPFNILGSIGLFSASGRTVYVLPTDVEVGV